MLSPPGRDNASFCRRHTSPVHRARVRFPRAFTEFLGHGKFAVLARPRQVHIARSVKPVAPHHYDLSVAIKSDGRMATLADRAIGGCLHHDVLRPCQPPSSERDPYSLVPRPRLSSQAANKCPLPSAARPWRPSVGAPGTSLIETPVDQVFP